MKLREMYDAVHIPEPMGIAATHALSEGITLSKKPMVDISELAIGFFKDKMGDRHAPLLLSVFCIIFTQVLFDPNVGCVTMSKYKGEKK